MAEGRVETATELQRVGDRVVRHYMPDRTQPAAQAMLGVVDIGEIWRGHSSPEPALHLMRDLGEAPADTSGLRIPARSNPISKAKNRRTSSATVEGGRGASPSGGSPRRTAPRFRG